MKKALTEGILILILFFGGLFGLQQVDWMAVFHVEEKTAGLKQEIGDLFWEDFQESETVITDTFIIESIDSLVTKICKSNNIDREILKVHLIKKDEINAFALPNGHLVIYSGLITEVENQEELCGIISHEIAHLQLNHVMKKVVNEVGASVIISITSGEVGGEVIKAAAKKYTTSAFSRKLEKEADLKAVKYLEKATINPEPFADFMYKMSIEKTEIFDDFSWLSSHPASKERAKYIVKNIQKENEIDFERIIFPSTLKEIKSKVE